MGISIRGDAAYFRASALIFRLMTVNLSEFRIPGSQECFYLPDFITPAEEEYLIRKV
jgi:hypothetical protein